MSPAERAWSTAEIVAGACELDVKQVQCARELYLATPEATWRLIARRDAGIGHILICGHNPGLSEIASRLGPKPQRRNLPTAGFATAVWHNAHWRHVAAGDRPSAAIWMTPKAMRIDGTEGWPRI